MKNSILLYLLLFTALAGAQVIDIPDAAFKAKLLSATTTNGVAADSSGDFIVVDENGDNQIDQDEAEEVRELYVQASGIASLEGIQYFNNLRTLHVQQNSLTAINLATLDHLKDLVCNNNLLTTLDFTGAEYLEFVNCSYNNLAELDFSGCPELDEFNCEGNNITYINIKNGRQHASGTANNQWGNNPNLAFICVDEEELDTVNALLSAGYGNTVNANSFCSFTPGGNYNTITGKLTSDANNNGCDAGDPPQKFMKVGVAMGSETCYTFTDALGNYTFYKMAGTFNVTPVFENAYFTADPLPYGVTFPFPVVGNSVETVDFCITPAGTNPDIEIVMVPVIPAVPGNDAVYKMVYKNKGNQVLNGSVNCTWNYTFFDFYPNSFMPDANTTSLTGPLATYTWDYSNLQPFESREILITLGVHTSGEAFPVNEGDQLTFTAQAAITGDALPADNTHQLKQLAVGSYNPNNIICIEGDTAPPSAIGGYLHYAVNFANDGTETAANVVIENDFDPAEFDISSVEVLNSSHPVTANITGNTLRLIVQSANLSVASGGNILFKAKSKSGIAIETAISTQSRIFFDYKAPVNTNTATTVFAIMGTNNPVIDASVTLYPNPAKNLVTIAADSFIQSVQLYDMQGRLLQTLLQSHTTATVDVSARAAGVYFVKVITQKGAKVEKIIKE